jgi:GT2 family glycosyltransferase
VLLSIVVLTHNRRRLLYRCLRSLLAQDWPSDQFEIIVADDGSTDGTRELVEELAVSHPTLRYYWQQRRGVAGARNLGLRHAGGSWISFVADDYELAPDYIRTVMGLFAGRPDRMVVRFKVVGVGSDFGSRAGAFYQDLSLVRRLAVWGVNRKPARIFWALASFRERATEEHGLEPAGGACFRREVFEQVGWFDESFQRAEDSEFGQRLRAHGIRIFYYPQHVIRHYVEPFPRAALAKAYRSGRFRFHYYQQLKPGAYGLRQNWPALAVEKAAAAAGLLVYCARSGKLGRLLVYAPFLASIELANKLGFLREAWRPKVREVGTHQSWSDSSDGGPCAAR